MSEKNNGSKEMMMCGCANCQYPMMGNGFHRFFALRLILVVIIVFMVFWLGMLIGELKGSIGYGPYGKMGVRYSGSPNMMYQNYYQAPAKTTPTPTTTK